MSIYLHTLVLIGCADAAWFMASIQPLSGLVKVYTGCGSPCLCLVVPIPFGQGEQWLKRF